MALSKITNASVADNAVHGRRNLVINGAMQVAQRGTSFTNATSYTLDRWLVGSFSGSGGDIDVEQGTFTPAQGYPERFVNYLQYTVNTMPSSPNDPNLQTRIEDCLTANGETVTLSFWAKVTSGTATIKTQLLNNIGGSGGGTTTSSHSLTTTWAKFTQTVTLAEVTSGTTGSSTYLRVNFSVPQGTSNGTVYQITGVQLEVGSATPFEHRSFGDELARCQRYYEHSYPYGTSAGSANGGLGAYHIHAGASRANFYGFVTTRYTVQKRASATVTVYSYSGTSGQISNGDSGANIGAVSVIQNAATSFLIRNNSGGTLADQPIIFHYSGDAEL